MRKRLGQDIRLFVSRGLLAGSLHTESLLPMRKLLSSDSNAQATRQIQLECGMSNSSYGQGSVVNYRFLMLWKLCESEGSTGQ